MWYIFCLQIISETPTVWNAEISHSVKSKFLLWSLRQEKKMLFGEHSIGIINAKKADTVNAAGPEMKKKKKKSGAT